MDRKKNDRIDGVGLTKVDLEVMSLVLVSNSLAMKAKAGTARASVKLGKREQFTVDPGEAFVGPANRRVHHACDAVLERV